MAGRTPREAVQNFLHPLRLIRSCVTTAQIDWLGGHTPGLLHPFAVNRGEPVQVRRSRGGPLAIRVAQAYRIVEAAGDRAPWTVQTAAYWYTLGDSQEREVIAYHWHPEGHGAVAFPHFHLGPVAGELRAEFPKAHCPTGRVTLERFLRFVIEDFSVTPRRPDWTQVLDRAQLAFEPW